MKAKIVLAAAFALSAAPLAADEIVMRDGKVHNGKLVRADESVVEFRIQGEVRRFYTLDVERIIFKQPELAAQPVRQVPPRPLPADPDTTTANAARSTGSPGTGPSLTYPIGTELVIRTTSEIDTDRNRVGDSFTATLEDPLLMGSQIVLPRGAEIRGRISEAKESGRLSGKSELALELTEVIVDGKSYILRTGEYSEVGSSRGSRAAKTAGGGAALGAIIGAIAGGGRGAAIGAATGAAAGTGVTLMTRGQTLKVPAETVLNFRLQAPLVLPAP